MSSQPPAKRPRLTIPSPNENLHPSPSSVSIKWDDVLTPSNYSPLQDNNTPVASTSAVTLDAVPASPAAPARFAEVPKRSRTKKGKTRAQSPDPLPKVLEEDRVKFTKEDTVRRYALDFSEDLVPHATHGGDRKDLRQWIPAQYLQDGVLAPEGLFIANTLTCVRLNNDLARRNRSEGILVVPRGHRDLQAKGEKDLWCLVCGKDGEEVTAVRKTSSGFNPRISKFDRHAGKPIHRQSIARALGIDSTKLPPEQQYGCPFRRHAECGHGWAERTDVVVRHINGTCGANPHSLKNVERYRRVYEDLGGLMEFPDDPDVYDDDSMWRPAVERELRRLEQADGTVWVEEREQGALEDQAGAHGVDADGDREGEAWDGEEGDEAADVCELTKADTSATLREPRPMAGDVDAAPDATFTSTSPPALPVEVARTRPLTPPAAAASRQGGHPDSTPLPAPTRLPVQVLEGRAPPETSTGHPQAPSTTPSAPATAGSTTPHGARLPTAAATSALPAPPPFAPSTALTPGAPTARELEFMCKLFDFAAYDAAHQAYLAQGEAEPRAAASSSTLKRKRAALEDDENAADGGRVGW